jgi:glutamate synthase domain-containing protein 3
MDALGIPVLSVPEIRDYQRINSQVTQLLEAGNRCVRLAGVDGQRLLLAGIAGPWDAVVELDGTAGPELAAELDSPALTVVCRGAAADGAGRNLRAGSLLVVGDAGDGAGFRQAGGRIVIIGRTGGRAGLEMSGGLLVLCGSVGALAGDRQGGGTIILLRGPLGSAPGHGRHHGRLVALRASGPAIDTVGGDDLRTLADAVERLRAWLPGEVAALIPS